MSFSGSSFDPHAARQSIGGRLRGGRFRLLMTATVVVLGGAIAFETWLWSPAGADRAEAAADIRQTVAQVPDYRLPPPKAVPDPSAPPAAVVPTAPRRSVPPPTQITWNVKAPDPGLAWFHDGRRPQLAKGCALRPGASIIRAALLTTIQSEVGGQAIAEISEDVYDADGIGRLLIPAGARAVGVYKVSGLGFQRHRLDFVWTELTMPDGEQLDLGSANGMDAAGSMGVGGEVRTRWGELIATAALLTVFDGIQRSAVGNNQTLADALQRSASQTTGQLGKEITRRVFDWEPNILIPSGTEIIISPQKTVQVC